MFLGGINYPRNRTYIWMTKSSSIHPIPFFFLLVSITIISRLPSLLRGLSPLLSLLPLDLSEIRPIQRTRATESQPGSHTLEIEEMGRMAREPDHQRIRVIEKRITTDWTGL